MCVPRGAEEQRRTHAGWSRNGSTMQYLLTVQVDDHYQPIAGVSLLIAGKSPAIGVHRFRTHPCMTLLAHGDQVLRFSFQSSTASLRRTIFWLRSTRCTAAKLAARVPNNAWPCHSTSRVSCVTTSEIEMPFGSSPLLITICPMWVLGFTPFNTPSTT